MRRPATSAPARPWLGVVTTGRYRLVLLVGSIAFKIPKREQWNDGLQCNRREAEWSPKDRRLCRVRRSLLSGAVLVMDRADAIGDAEFARLDAEGVIDRLVDYRKPQTGRPRSLCVERNGSNIGRNHEGRLVVIDYGDDDE